MLQYNNSYISIYCIFLPLQYVVNREMLQAREQTLIALLFSLDRNRLEGKLIVFVMETARGGP
jgi:hypothetical protein